MVHSADRVPGQQCQKKSNKRLYKLNICHSRNVIIVVAVLL